MEQRLHASPARQSVGKKAHILEKVFGAATKSLYLFYRSACLTFKISQDGPMHKKVDSTQLKVGMYIHDLSCDWMTHPFVRNRFLLTSEDEIRKILDAGIHDVVI